MERIVIWRGLLAGQVGHLLGAVPKKLLSSLSVRQQSFCTRNLERGF